MNAIETVYHGLSTKRFALPTERQVADLEHRIGVSFPNDYRQFILEFNGGYFAEPDILPRDKMCPVDCLTCLHGIGASHPVSELASEANLAIFDDNDPPQVVPVGYTIMGNLILLITHPEDCGCIVLKTFEKLYFLASGIEGFFGLIQKHIG